MNTDMNVETSSMLAKHHVYDIIIIKLYTHVLFKYGSIKYMHMHDVKTIVSLFSTDPTLTHANISTVTATVPLERDELGSSVLGVPLSTKCREIHQQSSSPAEERERLIHYYLNYSPYTSWSHLAGKFYYRQHHHALSATKKFIKREPGEFMCVITMYVCMPACKNQLWYY